LLDLPENTVRYNLGKLIESGFVERHAKWQRDINATYTL
jgi:repressor of nif and glnA expression